MAIHPLQPRQARNGPQPLAAARGCPSTANIAPKTASVSHSAFRPIRSCRQNNCVRCSASFLLKLLLLCSCHRLCDLFGCLPLRCFDLLVPLPIGSPNVLCDVLSNPL